MRWEGVLPRMNLRFRASVALCLTIGATFAQSAECQTVRDTTVAAPAKVATQPRAGVPSRLKPPLSPTRAFLYSFALPGFGQSKLDRGTSGALFASVELAAMTMVRRSNFELQEARRYRIDTLPSDFAVTVTSTGVTLTKNGVFTNRYSADLVRTRRLHLEDWLAVLAFNHLFAGADAFVASQLWDVPVSLSAIPQTNGAMLIATLRW